jgi:alpha-L-fucosidase
MFVDVVSKNGNLLLNVGPKPDGTLQDHEVKLLEAFGAWLKTYGDALYDSTPWSALPFDVYTTLAIRFTEKNGTLYVFFQSLSSGNELFVPFLQPPDDAAIELWRTPNDRITLKWKREVDGIRLILPPDHSRIALSPVQCISIHPIGAGSAG